MKKTKYEYNLIVIGGGSAGLVTSYLASLLKAKVLLIEKEKMGGDCLNTGCVPSKSLIHAAKQFHRLSQLESFGFENIDTSHLKVDLNRVMQSVKKSIEMIEPNDSSIRYESLGVKCIHGEAKLTSNHTVEVGDATYTSKSIVIATGASPVVPQIKGLENTDYLTSNTIWELNQLPKKLLVLGAGAIGLELAQSFARLGSKVTVVEMAEQILVKEDRKLADLLQQKLALEGIEILTSHRAIEFNEKQVICEYLDETRNKRTKEIAFDGLLLALGRKPSSRGLGLEQLGIEINTNGAIKTNPYLQTNIKNIYACGDVTGDSQFTHTAAHQAYYACVNALFSPWFKQKVNNRVIPYAVFTDPEIARVGLNEKQAQEQKIDYEIIEFDLRDLDRAIVEKSNHGKIQILTAKGKDKILGVSVIGKHAGETIAEFILAMKHSIGLNQILSTIHIYPTFADGNKLAAGKWKKAHTPTQWLPLLAKIHQWRR